MGQRERVPSTASNLMVGWTLAGTPSSLQALSSAFCGPTVLLNSDLQHLPALVFILQLLHLHQESHPAVPGQPLLQPGHQLSEV